jgi:hypothetical protein
MLAVLFKEASFLQGAEAALRGGAAADAHRCSGGRFSIAAANWACAAGSTGRYFIVVPAGSFPRKLLFFQFREGRTGRCTNPPPQFGQTFFRTLSAQAAQNVHS